MRALLIICLIVQGLITPYQTLAQYEEKEICTDTSEINVIVNSAYILTREKIYSLNKIKVLNYYAYDSSIFEDGWEDFWGNPIGIWNIYSSKKRWLGTVNYDSLTCAVDSTIYPFFERVHRIKLMADSIVRNAFGEKVFRENIRSDWYTYFFNKGHDYEFNNEGIVWKDDYPDGWHDPIFLSSNEYRLSYDLILDSSIKLTDYISLELDSSGSLTHHNLDKLDLSIIQNGFKMTYARALNLARENGYIHNDAYTTSLHFYYKFHKIKEIDRKYTILMMQETDRYFKKCTIEPPKRVVMCGFIFFNVWSFDAVSGELVSSFKNFYQFIPSHCTGGSYEMLTEQNDPRKQK